MNANRRWPVAMTLICATLLVAVACGGGTTGPPTSPTQTSAPQGAAVDSVQMAMATVDFGVGTNRVAFGLIDSESGAVRDVDVEVATFFLTEAGAVGPREVVKATFRKWPTGPGGVYTAHLTFDRPGSWGLGAVAIAVDGSNKPGSTMVQVKEQSNSPAIGSPAPRSESKTARDAASLEEITTDTDPDSDLYAMTIAEALDAGKPLMVIFSTPAYCRTATCGPQLDVVKEIKQRRADQMNFIHIEIYDNPLEIQGDLSRARFSPTFQEWNLLSEPWTFVVDQDGAVRAKFEGFANEGEIEEVLAGVLGEG